MKKFLMILIISAAALSAQDFRQNQYQSLFSDYKAISVGDMITIIVVESSQASNKSNIETGRSSDIGLSHESELNKAQLLPPVDFEVGSSNDFNGGGQTKTSGMVKTKISTTIDSILSNGNLIVSGSRTIKINGESQTVKVSGTIRPADVQADNSVLSFKVSDLEIIFEGEGMIDDNTEPGWLTKVFHWIF